MFPIYPAEQIIMARYDHHTNHSALDFEKLLKFLYVNTLDNWEGDSS